MNQKAPAFKRVLCAIACSALLALTSLPTLAADISVFAAASLTDSLKQIVTDYEKQSGDKILLNLGPSSTLARQIEEGAPADIFFSADEAKMDALETKGLLRKETRKSRLSNTLVVVVSADLPSLIQSPRDLLSDKVKHLALAEPKTVPAGIYAKDYLQKQNLWSGLESKVIPTENVRAALSAVEAGNVEAGIVYKTDAAISKKVKIACEIPAKEGPSISYPMAILRDSKQPAATQKFLRYLESNEATIVFEKFGFLIVK
ncbi:MAG: modA [Verrucomicrobiales bacterium]|nr:modA [Verrucomicrobiales bacterium]